MQRNIQLLQLIQELWLNQMNTEAKYENIIKESCIYAGCMHDIVKTRRWRTKNGYLPSPRRRHKN